MKLYLQPTKLRQEVFLQGHMEWSDEWLDVTNHIVEVMNTLGGITSYVFGKAGSFYIVMERTDTVSLCEQINDILQTPGSAAHETMWPGVSIDCAEGIFMLRIEI